MYKDVCKVNLLVFQKKSGNFSCLSFTKLLTYKRYLNILYIILYIKVL